MPSLAPDTIAPLVSAYEQYPDRVAAAAQNRPKLSGREDSMSERIGRLYRITDAGAKALRARNSVPAWYRSVLIEITKGETPSMQSRGIRRHPPRRVLEEMETLGFIEAASAGSYFLAKYGAYRESLPELRTIIDKLEAISP